MIKVEMFFGVVYLVLWIYCVIEVISTPEDRVRSLPKLAWIFIVLLFPLVGSIAWLAAGRPRDPRTYAAYDGPAPAFPEYDRPGRALGSTPEEDEEFLRKVRERAEEQRKKYKDQQRPDDEGA